MARDIGYLAPDLTIGCRDVTDEDVGDRVCKAQILGGWVDTASFRYVRNSDFTFPRADRLTRIACTSSLSPLPHRSCASSHSGR